MGEAPKSFVGEQRKKIRIHNLAITRVDGKRKPSDHSRGQQKWRRNAEEYGDVEKQEYCF